MPKMIIEIPEKTDIELQIYKARNKKISKEESVIDILNTYLKVK